MFLPLFEPLKHNDAAPFDTSISIPRKGSGFIEAVTKTADKNKSCMS